MLQCSLSSMRRGAVRQSWLQVCFIRLPLQHIGHCKSLAPKYDELGEKVRQCCVVCPCINALMLWRATAQGPLRHCDCENRRNSQRFPAILRSPWVSASRPQDSIAMSCHCFPSYPTIYWVPAKHKSMPEKYEGAREVKVCFSLFVLLHFSLTNTCRTSWRTLRSTPRFPSKLPRPRRPRPRRASRRTSSDPIGCASAMRLFVAVMRSGFGVEGIIAAVKAGACRVAVRMSQLTTMCMLIAGVNQTDKHGQVRVVAQEPVSFSDFFHFYCRPRCTGRPSLDQPPSSSSSSSVERL